VTLTITNSLITHSTSGGVFAFASAGSSITIVASGNMITANAGAGLGGSNNGGAVKFIASRNTVTLNVVGFDGNLVTFNSMGDNAVNGNTTETTGTINGFSWM
jgi:hypothetical protein